MSEEKTIMNDENRRRADAIARSVKWHADNLPLITVPSVLNTKFTALAALHAEIQSLAGASMAAKGLSAGEFADKGGDRETLRDSVSAIANIAKAMEPDFPGMEAKYPFRRNMNDADLLATARAFATNAAVDSANFIAYGLPATFIADLTAVADAFESSRDDASAAKETGVGTTADIGAKIAHGMVLKRTIEHMIKPHLAANPAALASFHSAAHVEAAPKKKNGSGSGGGPIPVGGGPGPTPEPPTS